MKNDGEELTLKTLLSALTGMFDRMDLRQLALEEQMHGVRGDIDGLKGGVFELKSDVAMLKTDVADLKTDVHRLDAKIDDVAETLADSVASHERRLIVLESAA